MARTTAEDLPRTSEDVNRARTWIAFIIIGISIVGICVISVVAVVYVGAQQRPEMTRLVFAAVLPLFGTWVGAVLAFYFSRDNLQAASQTTLDAVRSVQSQLTGESAVTDIMIPLDRISPLKQVADLTAAEALSLSQLAVEMLAVGNARVPILDQARTALLVVHQPDIDNYSQANSVSVASLGPTATVAELLKDPATAAVVRGFVAVAPSATVADARRALAKAPAAKDVFVTQSGTLAGAVLGLLTNTDLVRAR